VNTSTIVVAGTTGNLGGRIVKTLLACGATVSALVRHGVVNLSHAAHASSEGARQGQGSLAVQQLRRTARHIDGAEAGVILI